MGKINVVISSDDNYAQHLSVVIASCLYNAGKNDDLNFYILDGAISPQKKEKIISLKSIRNCNIDFIKVDENDFLSYKDIKTHEYISIAAYYRLKLASLLSNIDRVIYFDCDIVVNSSLKDLFNANLDNKPIGAVVDINKKMFKKNPSYINSGMLVMDLDLIRKENIEEEFLNWTKNHATQIKTGDQEIINEVLKGRIKILNEKWNVQSSNFTNRSSYTDEPRIVHFVAKKKPWHYASYSYHRNLYFKYLQLTPWKFDKDEEKHWTIDNQKDSLLSYFKYRPFFAFRPRFYKALFETYIKPLFNKKPVIKKNTFLLWEPCSKSHSEVLPGFAKYLLDLGYHVSVLAEPNRIKEGLFSRFENENLSLNKMSQKQIKKYLAKNDLANVEGILITTAGKLCDSIHYEQIYKTFDKNTLKNKVLFVEHEVCHSVDNKTWSDKIITLRKLDYKNADSTVINPHYFGEIKNTDKNEKITRFVTVGAIQEKKKNNGLIIKSALELVDKGYENFKIVVIGKGNLKGLPKKLHPYFEIKGRLPFEKMYQEIEKADFMLTSYNEQDPKHIRYNTSGTSGNFQLVYGFLKPCIITEGFAPINGLNEKNAILYKGDENYPNALERAINLSKEQYSELQDNLKIYQQDLYNKSLNNLKELING